MEGDVMDKLEDMSSVYEFDPFTGNIPATKVEITVSCRRYSGQDEGFGAQTELRQGRAGVHGLSQRWGRSSEKSDCSYCSH
ncbi:hypothetical protein COCON_G00173090 [Conger conger]|uniref:Uncharacterized protein n=1 Tax=Conger conger TaxID=82655 RepID=A0A9Q1HRS5_CONCO|nr:hypothetical protein COCON_G00173090 [Conger conger]